MPRWSRTAFAWPPGDPLVMDRHRRPRPRRWWSKCRSCRGACPCGDDCIGTWEQRGCLWRDAVLGVADVPLARRLGRALDGGGWLRALFLS